MKDTAPIGQGIIAVAALFGVVGGGVAFVMYEFGLIGAVFIGGIVAALVAVLLWLGWRKPNAPYTGRPDIKVPDIAGESAIGSAKPTATTAAASTAPTAAASTAPGAAASTAPGAAASTASGAAASTAPGAAASTASGAAASAAPSAAASAAPGAAASTASGAAASTAAPEPKAAPASAAATPAPGPAAASAAVANGTDTTAAAAGGTPDYDGDGVLEGTDEGTRPAALEGPRDGKADNLKEIKGIGPKLEKLCNRLGFYHFDQIAGWTADEVAWVDANLEGFKGRVTRDTWVAQAKILAAGGETAFSKKVEKGGVY